MLLLFSRNKIKKIKKVKVPFTLALCPKSMNLTAGGDLPRSHTDSDPSLDEQPKRYLSLFANLMAVTERKIIIIRKNKYKIIKGYVKIQNFSGFPTSKY